MFAMLRAFLTVTAVWSLVASPVLCRGGWLRACCEHETTMGDSADAGRAMSRGGCEDPDCGCPVEERPKEPVDDRECAPCAAVCAGLFKPGDDTSVILDGSEAALATGTVHDDLIQQASVRWMLAFSHTGRQRLPFPRSDIPLLI